MITFAVGNFAADMWVSAVTRRDSRFRGRWRIIVGVVANITVSIAFGVKV